MFSSTKELPCSCWFSDDHVYIEYSSPPMALSSFPTQNPLYSQSHQSYLYSDCSFLIHHWWLPDYNLPTKGVLLKLVPKPPPTAVGGLCKQPNRVVDKLQGLERRRATPLLGNLLFRAKPCCVKAQHLQLTPHRRRSRIPHLNSDGALRTQTWVFLRSVTWLPVPVTAAAQRIAYPVTSTVVMASLVRSAVRQVHGTFVYFWFLAPGQSRECKDVLLTSPRRRRLTKLT
ncbi:hypothetical protein CSKR_108903 [Clonorchis sinensis]|uniref:Uncharacterized protein n=1 Tax=Clonorchis sinensis TaxID=79923 RepID=A0A419PDI1_CLOSI|nr:hypothetical protein CSKR_108903 [Clonorchis sinensis]